MPDPTPTPTDPQLQPGPNRTPDGTIPDQSLTPTPTSTPTDSSTGQTVSPFNKGTPSTAAPPGAPETYADYKVPDGYQLDAEVAAEANKLFKASNLNQDQAQSLVDFYVKQTQEAFEAPFKAFVDMTNGWKGEVANRYGADIEPGGKHYVAVGRLLSQLGTAEAAFRTAMDETGVGSHPAFVAAFIKLAEMLGEGGHIAGNAPSPLGQVAPGAPDRPTAAQALYPHLPSSAKG